MKKMIIALAASTALIASPALAGGLGSAWDAIDATEGTGEQLVLGAGLANTLDQCGNGKPFYTVFLPIDEVLDAFLDEQDLSVPGVLAKAGVVANLLNDHIAVGSYAPDQLSDPSITRIITRSGYIVTKSLIGDGIYVNGNLILDWVQTCNGFVYWIDGIIDSTPQVPTSGVNPVTTEPAAPAAPAESSGLPDTL